MPSVNDTNGPSAADDAQVAPSQNSLGPYRRHRRGVDLPADR
jgi:hypothetical protein